MYHVFLSHSSADKPAVEQLARRLRDEAGLAPFLDKWHLVPGAPWQTALEQALANSETMAVFFGPSGRGPWHNEELQLALNRAVQLRNDFRVIPVLLPDANPEQVGGFLSLRTWVDFREGLDSDAAFKRLVAGIKGEAVSPDGYELPADPSPYRGLRRFEAKHTRFFFGREQDRERLVAKLRSHAFVAVVGASGSGKSSLVRAGLLPRLAQGKDFPGSEEWATLLMVPGPRPLQALAAQLATLGPEEHRLRLLDELATRLEERPDGLRTAAQALLAASPRPLLLVVDQFEELFTQGEKLSGERGAQVELFIANLSDAAERGGKALRILLTLRADFLDRCLAHPPLRALLEDGQILLGELDEPALREAIVQPAKEVGALFEKGLVSRILQDVKQQRGSLPLLQHALHELWLARRGPWLTEESYERSGGVAGALQKRAQASYDALSPEQQRLARGILIRLAELGEGVSDTRRQVARSELYPADAAREQVESVLEALSREEARLIVVGEKTVEVTHEALIQQWPLLRGWLLENRDALRTHRRLTEASLLWERKGRDPSYLYGGARLAEAQEWHAKHAEQVNPLERDFLEASGVLAERQRREEEERRRKEVEAAQALARAEAGRARLFRMGVGIVGGLAVVASILAVIAFIQARAAEKRAQESLAFQLSAQSELTRSHRGDSLPLSVLLGIESLKNLLSLETSQALSHGLDLLPRAIARLPHEGPVSSVALSPDGKLVATASQDNTARLWEAATGKHRSRLSHGGPVAFVAFSPDGKTVATASGDKTARLWVAETGRELAILSHDGPVTFVAFSPDGETVATASEDKTARLWATATGSELARFPHEDSVSAVAFSPDGKIVATAGGYYDRAARLWDVVTGRPLKALSNDCPLDSVAFSPDGETVATACGDSPGEDYTASLWEVATGQRLARLPHDGSISSVAFSPDGNRVATASSDRAARLWDAATGRQLAILSHDASVKTVVFSPDGKSVATASADNTARLWETETGRQLATLAHDNPVVAVAFSLDGKTVATASEDKTARLWETATGRQRVNLPHEGSVWAVVFSPDGKTVATTGNDDTAHVWEVVTGRRLASLPHGSVAESVAFSPDGKTVATVANNSVNLWEAATGQLVASLPDTGPMRDVAFSPDGKIVATTTRLWEVATRNQWVALPQDCLVISSVAFSPDGKTVATVCDDSLAPDYTVRLRAVATGQQLAELPHKSSVRRVAFSPDGKRVATASSDKAALLWDVATGRQLQTLPHGGSVEAVAFSPDGKTVATGGRDHYAYLWGTETGLLLARLPHAASVEAVAFSPNGKAIATASDDKSVGLWEVATGRQFASFLHGDRVGAVAFSPDGTIVATASNDSTARLWFWLPEDLMDAACARLDRNLTPEEWRQYIGDREPYRKTCPNLP